MARRRSRHHLQAFERRPRGGSFHAAALSIKSAQQVTRAGFPQDFVTIAWAQWFGVKTERKLRVDNDAVVLVTGNLAHEVRDAWSNLLHDIGDAAVADLMRHLRLLHFDFEAVPSRDEALALDDCQRLLRSGDAAEAQRLWDRLIGIADARRTGGTIDLPQMLAELRSEFDFRGHPDYRRDAEVLVRLSRDLMADVRTQIAGVPPLPQVADRARVQDCLDRNRACLLVGELGCGKSALAKEIAQSRYGRIVWIAENTLDQTATELERTIGIRHSVVQILAALPEPCLVVFDGIDRYPLRALRLACHLMRHLLAEAGPQHVHVLATAQFEGADRLIRRLAELDVPPSLRSATAIDRPSENDVQTLAASIPELTWASLRPELRPLLNRAVRLYGQRLLEQSANGAERWQQEIAGLGDGSPTGSLMRDLFLESLFLASNSAALLERSWAALCANCGQLLNRMLDRFLFVATLPDPRVAAFVRVEAEGPQFEHLFRVPYWPYWGPLLTVLHAHRADVVRLAPHNAAKICSLWLKEMPLQLTPGQAMPWRGEAAELALAIGREIQTLNAEGDYFSNCHDKAVYEAVLWAAPDLPDEVAATCLELAERRDLNPDIRRRVVETHERRREERRQWLASHPESKRAPPPLSIWSLGRLCDPWPDGPRARVDAEFQEACLDTGAFSALARAKPDAALEVLLAICIEEPQREDHFTPSMPESGVKLWRSGDPPSYCRGPFLQFLRQASEHGLSFVLRLVNFATRRFAGDELLEHRRRRQRVARVVRRFARIPLALRLAALRRCRGSLFSNGARTMAV